MSETDGLRAELSLLDAIMINVGTMVASAIYLVPASIAAYFSGVFPTILVWVAGAAVSLCGALCVAELSAAMPAAGGQMVPLERTYGRVVGFLYGWGNAVIINPASIAAIAVGFATYLEVFVPGLGPTGVKVVAVASILGLTGLNCFGLKLGAVTQDVLTIVKIVGAVALVLICFLLPGGHPANWQPFWPKESLSQLAGPFGLAMIAVLYAYDGWIEITYVGSEMRRPARDLPVAIIVSTVIVSILYVAVAAAVTHVLGPVGVAKSTRVAADAATVVLGSAGAFVIAGSILISTLGANNGIVFTAARVPYAMARGGTFFRWAGRLDRRTDVPVIALVVQGIWCSILAVSGRYDELITYVVFVAFLGYGLSALAVMILRRRDPAMARPYRAWGYPVTPIVFLGFAGYLVLNTVREQPGPSAVGVALLAAGLPFYYGLGWHRVDEHAERA